MARPSWRGRLHLIGLWSAVPAIATLAVAADGARSRAAVIVYGLGLCAMLAVSTIYHRWVHTLTARAVWRRADHATIFAAIAGTTSAVTITTLDTSLAVVMLIVVWGAAGAGAAFKMAAFERASRLGMVLYLALGWAGVLLTPAVWQRGGVVATLLLLAGGVVYSGGAIAFHRRWPTLRPARFSYHEVWHAHTIVAAGLHFGAISLLVR